jgi:iron complex outermembrane receptor protein
MSIDRQRKRLGATAWAAILSSLCMLSARAEAEADLASMSIEELSQIEVTSVSKRAQPLSNAPAAIYVITREDIRRSGAITVPEMLRLAPNLQVAQVTASRYAITARGFNGGAADKLLVLVDGRSIYTPVSSGVNWDLQEVPPEDIDRIEVISGPGGTLWGANAVNGVINIITRKSSDTGGVIAEVAGGNAEISGRLQYGGKIADNVSYRAYVGGFRHWDRNVTGPGANARDSWHKVQGGFRTDWEQGDDRITVQGDIFDGSEQQFATVDETISGHNLLSRWTHIAGQTSMQVQAYYDHIQLTIPNSLANYLDTFDIQAQHNFSLGTHRIVWGGGYRVASDQFPAIPSASQTVQFIPESRTFGLWNLFVQDSFAVTDKLQLTAGLKIEKEPYTGVELMPNVRLSWAITDTNLLWAAASRAVRVPSRLDRDVTQRAGSILTLASGNMQPVRVTAYELGYRAQPLTNLSFSISAFYNVYPNLRSAEPTNGNFPLVFANGMEGETYGVEFWGNYGVTDWWRLTAGANWLHKDLRFKPGSFGVGGLQIAGNDPEYQLSLRSTMDLGRAISVNFDLRQIGALPAPASPAYAELNARIAWAPSSNLEISVTGSNLLHAYHAEFGTTQNTLQVGPVGVRIGRSVSGVLRWRF